MVSGAGARRFVHDGVAGPLPRPVRFQSGACRSATRSRECRRTRRTNRTSRARITRAKVRKAPRAAISTMAARATNTTMGARGINRARRTMTTSNRSPASGQSSIPDRTSATSPTRAGNNVTPTVRAIPRRRTKTSNSVATASASRSMGANAANSRALSQPRRSSIRISIRICQIRA